MGERTETLAKQFEATNEAVIAAVEQCSGDQWSAVCAGEAWPVGVTAHHVGSSHQPVAGLAQAIANGQPLPPLTAETLNAGNAKHAQDFANCTKEETIVLLRDGGVQAAAIVRGLGDEQLNRSATVFGNEMSAQQAIEGILIGHPRSHLESIRAAMGTA
ncbi:MAG: DinB family protein [Dehalococcoidia bacterium]